MPLGNRKIQRKRTGKSKSIPNPSIELDDVAENDWGVEDDSPATAEAENNGDGRKSEWTQKQSIAPISRKKKAPTKKSGNVSSSRSSNRDSSSEEEIILSPDEELEEDSSHGPSPLVEHESDESSILLDESEQSEQQGSHQDDAVSKGAKSRSRLDEDDEEFELDEADEDQNEKKNAVARSRNGKSTRQKSSQESFDSDNDADNFEDKPPPGRTRKGRRASLREVDSDEEFSDHDEATSNRRDSDEDHVEEEEEEVAKARKTKSARQRSRNGQTSNTRASSLREEDSDEELDGHGKEENEAPRRQKRARATRNGRGSVQDFSTEDSDVEDHEEEKTVARSRKTESARQASRIARKSKITKKAASLREEDSDEEFDIHDKEENEAPTRQHRARATRNGKRSVQYLGMDDSDDEEDHVEDEEVAKHKAKSPRRESRKTKASKTDERAVSEPRQRRTPKKQTQKVAYEDFGESDEADEQKEPGTKTRLNDSDDDFSPGGDDDSSHGDSGESFKEVKKSKRKKPTVTKRKKAKTAKKAPKRRSKAAYSDESSDGEEQKRSRPPRRKTRRPPSDLAEFIAGSEEEEEDDADESDYEESMSTLASRRSRRQTASRKNLKEYSSSEVEENLEAEEISSAAHVSGKRVNRRVAKGKAGSSANREKRNSRAKKRKATTKKQKEEDSDDSESEDQGQAYSTPLSNRGRSPRQSASKAAKKVATLLEENNEDDDFQMNWKGGDKEEDEEFEIDSQGGDSDSSAEIADVDEDDESLVEKKENNAGLVDVDESFLDPDISSGDDNSEVVRTPPSLKIVKVKTPNRRKNDESSDDESVVGDVESDEEKPPASPFVCAHMPRCDSTSDAITMDALPTRHICFYMPDGKTKQCFALETLHKIALSGVVNYEDGKQTFKQPPHFRSAMEDDILDQIASRFGRDAVDPAGQFYNRKRLPPARTDGDSHSDAGSDYILNFDGNLANDDAFTEHLNKYLTNQMGSRDVYCCPVCYTEAHIRLETDGIEAVADEASDEEPEDVNLEFRSDPITVLGCVDEDKFVMASGFCFAKLVQVKEHLRKDHGVDPSTISGNDLYKRFQIRASDGLLQRYLDRRNGNRVSRQGQMMSYWYQGNNELFVYLLHLMDRCRLIRNEAEDHVGDEEEDEDVKGSLAFEENLQTFWSTFSNRGKRLWDFISQPYRKMTKGELKEFLADDVDIAESGDEVAYHMINRDMDAEPTPEDEIVAALRQSRGRDVEEESSSEDEEVSVEEEEWDENDAEEGAFDSSEEELAEIDGQYSEEEEEDEWVSKIKSKGKARAKRNRRKSNTKVVVVGQAKKLGGKKRRSSEPYSTPPMKSDSSSAAVAAVASSNKRRSILEDSESD